MQVRSCALIAMASATLLVGCVQPRRFHRAEFTPPVRPPADPETPDPPRIVSAHFGVNDAPPLGGLDGLPVVFSGDVDAASLGAHAFVVVLADGRRVRPQRAILAPANEGDENRTVLLVGDYGDPKDNPPTDVLVVGAVYGEDGQSLQGLSAKVEDFEAAGRVVVAERVEAASACTAAKQVVRTYWVDGLRGVAAADLAAVSVTLADGSAVAPTAFDDHDLDEDQRGEDNVLDLCLAAESPARRVSIAAGAFTDPPGHSSARVDIEIR